MDRAEKNHRYYLMNSPFPVRFGILKARMQQDAFHNPELLGATIHSVAVSIVRNYYAKREVFQDRQLEKLIELAQIKRHNIKFHVYKKKYGVFFEGKHQLSLFPD